MQTFHVTTAAGDDRRSRRVLAASRGRASATAIRMHREDSFLPPSTCVLVEAVTVERPTVAW